MVWRGFGQSLKSYRALNRRSFVSCPEYRLVVHWICTTDPSLRMLSAFGLLATSTAIVQIIIASEITYFEIYKSSFRFLGLHAVLPKADHNITLEHCNMLSRTTKNPTRKQSCTTHGRGSRKQHSQRWHWNGAAGGGLQRENHIKTGFRTTELNRGEIPKQDIWGIITAWHHLKAPKEKHSHLVDKMQKKLQVEARMNFPQHGSNTRNTSGWEKNIWWGKEWKSSHQP